MPFELLWSFAEKWQKIYNIEFSSLQLEGHQNQRVNNAIESGNLLCPLKSKDWLNTAKVLETLDLLIGVDTSVALPQPASFKTFISDGSSAWQEIGS